MKTYTQPIEQLGLDERLAIFKPKPKITPHEVLTNIAKKRTPRQQDTYKHIQQQLSSKNPRGLDHMQAQGMKNLYDVGAKNIPDKIDSVVKNAYAKYKSQNPEWTGRG